MASIDQIKAGVISEWQDQHVFSAIISSISEHEVTCAIVIDEESGVIEHRAFDQDLFQIIPNLGIDSAILIKTYSRPGAFLIEVLDGTEIANLRPFQMEHELEELIASGFNQDVA